MRSTAFFVRNSKPPPLPFCSGSCVRFPDINPQRPRDPRGQLRSIGNYVLSTETLVGFNNRLESLVDSQVRRYLTCETCESTSKDFYQYGYAGSLPKENLRVYQ